MSILYEASKYPGRSFDVNIMQGVKPSGDQLITMSLFSSKGSICTGIQKLIQRFVILMLTPKGSVTFQPERGCNFVEEVTGTYSEDEVETSFYFNLVDVKEQLQDEETDDMPIDERYGSATLEDVSFIGDTLSLVISLTSLSGTTNNIILPIYA